MLFILPVIYSYDLFLSSFLLLCAYEEGREVICVPDTHVGIIGVAELVLSLHLSVGSRADFYISINYIEVYKVFTVT